VLFGFFDEFVVDMLLGALPGHDLGSITSGKFGAAYHRRYEPPDRYFVGQYGESDPYTLFKPEKQGVFMYHAIYEPVN
jgi:hypothetical protein